MRGLTRPVWTRCRNEEVYGESSSVSPGKRCRIRAPRAGVTHGFLPGPQDMEASFFVVGQGIVAGTSLGAIGSDSPALRWARWRGSAAPRDGNQQRRGGREGDERHH